MSDEEQMVPQDQPESVSTPDSEPAAEPDNEAPETGTEQPAEPETPAEPEKTEPEKQPWFLKRIHQQSAKIADLARQTENLAREKADLEARLSGNGERQPGEADKPPMSPADIDRLVELRAQEHAKVQSFNQACDKTAEVGAKEFPDFNQAVGTLQALGMMKPETVQVVLDAAGENAHKVLYQLGKNPEEAERVFGLSPIKMAVELSKLGASAPGKQPPPLSKAPDPIKPISGNAVVAPDEGKMSDDEWWRRYNSR